MAVNVWNVVTTLTVIMSLVHTASALMCYQCNSTGGPKCQEIFDYNPEYEPLQATNCDLFEARYCVKTTGIWGGVAGTRRFCSAKNLGNQCQYIQYPDHDRLYRACVFTCSGDDCNHAPKHTPWLAAPILLLTAAALYFLR